MNQSYNKAERAHIQRVKELPCSVCGAPPPSAAHHIDQDCAYTCIALCYDCHQNPKLGFHGEKINWNIYKMSEITALNVTLMRMLV
jgi:hypothetical protein